MSVLCVKHDKLAKQLWRLYTIICLLSEWSIHYLWILTDEIIQQATSKTDIRLR